MRQLQILCGICLLTVRGVAQDARPASDAAFFAASKAELIASLALHQPRAGDSLETDVREEAKSLDVLTGFATPVWLGRDCGTNSHPTLGIIVDLAQLEAIRRDARVQQFVPVLRWLMAHEKVHQLQYRLYTERITRAPLADRQVYEAQADILAGKYLLESIEAAASPQDNETILDALRVAYELGVEQYALADHPSHESRLTAVRLGMAAGMITKMQQLGGAPAQGSILTLQDKLNIRPGEDLIAWSLRTAHRIVNYRRPDIVDLVLTDQDIVYSKDPSQPVASYWFTYENRGMATLAVDLEIQCVAASRADLDDVMKWQKISVRNHTIDLSPGGRKTISGSLRWYGDAQLMPRIIAPPQPTALISVETVGAGAPASLETGASLGANSAAGERQDLSTSIARIVRNAAGGFRDLRAGPGRKIDDYVVYPAETNLPEALRTEVWVAEAGSDGESYVRSLLARGIDANMATATFSRVFSRLKATVAMLGPWVQTGGGGPNPSECSFTRGRIEINLRKRKQTSADRYDISLTVRQTAE